MDIRDTAKILALVSAAYQMDVNDLTVDAWHGLMEDLDGPAAIEATKRLCRRDSPFPPRPGEIIAEARQLDGDSPPPLNAAAGYYMMGKWDVHPAVRAAARRVCWDRKVKPVEAEREFRSHYSAELDAHEHSLREPAREVIAEARSIGGDDGVYELDAGRR